MNPELIKFLKLFVPFWNTVYAKYEIFHGAEFIAVILDHPTDKNMSNDKNAYNYNFFTADDLNKTINDETCIKYAKVGILMPHEES